MPINIDIPGQLHKEEMCAIELIANLVPENGVILEVGSLLGRSSWIWANSAHPSVRVYCIDPWEAQELACGFNKLAYEHGQSFTLEQFKRNTIDCPNIFPLQGYSPRDFFSWNMPIDLYFEDAVHTNPLLHSNLEFWRRYLKPDGIICGHDFTSKFRDVCVEVIRLSKELNRVIRKVRTLWYLLPEPNSAERRTLYKHINAQLECLYPQENQPTELEMKTEDFVSRRKRVVNGLGKFKYKLILSQPKSGSEIQYGNEIVCSGTITNTSGKNWPIIIDGLRCLRVGAELYAKRRKTKVAAARAGLDGNVFRIGETRTFKMSLPTNKIPIGSAEVMIDLVYDYATWFGQRGAKPARVTVLLNRRLNY